jgi:N-methylhydantoinase B
MIDSVDTICDPIRLEVFKHLFVSITEEMGVVLRKSSFSPNIKERRDFSCAIFNDQGQMVAQAAHIPVHLGAMPLSVEAIVRRYENDLHPGDVIVLNDPFLGGTHLPDITLVSPIFINSKKIRNAPKVDRPIAFVANRAHHADVGGITPGSMPIAREIYQEGLIIPPVKLYEAGELNKAVLDLILANVRTPEERFGDLQAQIAANLRGGIRLLETVEHYGYDEVHRFMNELLAYTERLTRLLLERLPDGDYEFTDMLDNDGITQDLVPIKVRISIREDEATVDFSGSAAQRPGGVNAVYAITLSVVYYVFRCLIGLDAPNNSGCMIPIHVITPAGTIVNANRPAPVAGGNVETSQRIVDVLLGALAQACPERVPAASQGTMNNITIGGWDTTRDAPFAYYETIGGGMGASPTSNGPSAVHSHMTNTLNTPVEALEYAYPLLVKRYEIRHASGGLGKFQGGNGIRRDIQVLTNAQVTLLTERRITAPYGIAGGQCGAKGENILIRNDQEIILPGKGTFDAQPGDIISIRTPGGGGYGEYK